MPSISNIVILDKSADSPVGQDGGIELLDHRQSVGVLHEMDEVVVAAIVDGTRVMEWVMLLLNHGEEGGNGNVECTWLWIVSGHCIGWTW